MVREENRKDPQAPHDLRVQGERGGESDRQEQKEQVVVALPLLLLRTLGKRRGEWEANPRRDHQRTVVGAREILQ